MESGQRLRVGNELIEGGGPAVVKAHLFVLLLGFEVVVDRHGDVAGTGAFGLHGDDAGHEGFLGGAIAGQEGVGEDEALHGDHIGDKLSALFGDYVDIPVAIQIPADAAPSTPGAPSDRIEWERSLTADLPGIDFCVDFIVPVFQ